MSNLQLVEKLLRVTSPEGLLRTFAALTHQLHSAEGDASAAIRTQRDIVEAELLRRQTPTISEVDLNRAAQAFYENTDGRVHLSSMTDKPAVVKGLRAALASLSVALPDPQD